MAATFQGHCPICGEQLFRDDRHPETARCPIGHYSCEAKRFDQLWDEFNTQVERLGLHRASEAYAEKLLKDLKSLNTVKRTNEGEDGTQRQS